MLLLRVDNINVTNSPHLPSDRAPHKDASANEKFPQGNWLA